MPVAWRLHVLEERLKREYDVEPTVESVGLYDLSAFDQNATLVALMERGAGLPVVLVNGGVACVGDIDQDAVSTYVSGIVAG